MNEVLALLRDAMQIPWVRSGVFLLGAFVAARVTDRLVSATLKRAVRRTKTNLDDRIVELLHKPIFRSVMLVGLHLSIAQLAVPESFVGTQSSILKTLGIFVWIPAIFRINGAVLDELGRSDASWIEARTLPLFENLGKIAIFGGALYCFLVAWNLDVGPWIASAGIAGVAIGFAAQDSLSNLFGGIFILADAPYKLGDFIVVDGMERGRVTHIGLRSTRILTRDDIEVILPNAQIANAKVVNESGGPWRKHRIRLSVGVAYGSDVDEVRKTLHDAAAAISLVAAQPEPQVRFVLFGDSSLDFELRVWIDDPATRGRAIDALHTEIYRRFKDAGIEIPFPQRTMHMLRGGTPDAEN